MEEAEGLIASPVTKHFAFAPPVFEVIDRAHQLLAPLSEGHNLARATDSPKPLKHILALDVRHGADWIQQCRDRSERFG